MKKTITRLTLLLTLAAPAVAMADVIVMHDGTTMQVHNIDVASKWLYYTDTPDDDAETRRISVDRVFGYKIGDGAMTTIGTTPAPAPEAQTSQAATSDGPRFVEPQPASDNAALIASYNNHPTLEYLDKKPQPDKLTHYFISLWGIEDNSILSDDNVEIGFEKVYLDGDKDRSVIGHYIKVRNKTAKPLYIDLASCYKIMNGGYSVPYFTNSVYNEGTSGTVGGSLNLGAVAGALGVGGALGTLASGVNVGKSSTQSTGITTAEQQILTVPPMGSVALPGTKVSNGKKILECYEPIYFYNPDLSELRKVSNVMKFELHMTISEDISQQKILDNQNATRETLNIGRWAQTDYALDDTPKKIGRLITYSTSPDFSTYTTLPVNLYMRGAFGINLDGISLKGRSYFYFNDKTYDCITDKEHFITGYGVVKKK